MRNPDIYSITLCLQVYSAVVGVIALVLWRLHRNLHGLFGIAVGYIGLAVGFSLIHFRTPTLITFHNIVVMFSVAILCEGLVEFMGKSGRAIIVVAVTIFTAIAWPIMQMQPFDTLGLRITVMSCLVIPLFLRPLVIVLQQRKVFGLAGYALALSILIYVGSVFYRMLVALFFEGAHYTFGQHFQPWFMLSMLVAACLSFFSLTLMVGTRLSNALHEQSMSLEAERRVQAQLRQFLHTLGHELRTPLAIVDRSTEMMEMLLEAPSPEIKKRLDTIRSTVERTGGMIDNLLNSERVETSAASFAEVNFVKVVGDTVAVMAEKYGIDRLQVSLPSDAVSVLGDKNMLSIAVQNIVDNALKFSPRDTQVAIRLSYAKGKVKLTVTDEGVGLPADELMQIGKKFYRGSNVESVKGSGLGLHLVHEIVSKHNGSVELQNVMPKGVKACLLLPHV